jgi:hypothetical protein
MKADAKPTPNPVFISVATAIVSKGEPGEAPPPDWLVLGQIFTID